MRRFFLGTVVCLSLAATASAQTPPPIEPPAPPPASAQSAAPATATSPAPTASAPSPAAASPAATATAPAATENTPSPTGIAPASTASTPSAAVEPVAATAPPVEPALTRPVPAPPVLTPGKLRLEREIPEWRIVISNLFVFRYNELGLEDQIRFGVQRRLYHSHSDVTRDNFLFFGIYPKINPAYVKLGPSLELQPASFFNLRLAAEFIDFFSTFGFLQSYASPNADYSPTTRKTNEENATNYGTSGFHVMVEPVLQFKVGPIALREKFAAEYWQMNLNNGDRVWYDATLDTLVPANGWVITNDLDVLFIHKFQEPTLTVGLRWSVVDPIYSADQFTTKADADAYNGRNMHQRLGPVIAYTFFDRGYLNYNKPTLLLIVNWYLQHPYRTGTDPGTPEALPYILAGFSFQSDLLH